MLSAQSSPRSSENGRARIGQTSSPAVMSAAGDRDARGTRARPRKISAGPVLAAAKLLTEKEQAAAEEAKEKLDRMVKVSLAPVLPTILTNKTVTVFVFF